MLLDDMPEREPSALWPGLATFASRLGNQIDKFPNTSPIVLTGDWGSGKTTLLRALQKDLEDKNIHTIWFDAWRYEHESGLLPALLRSMWDSAPLEFREKEQRKSTYKKVWTISAGIAAKLALSAASAMTLGALGVFSGGVETSDELLGNGSSNKSLQEGSVQPPPDATEQLQSGFREILTEAWPERSVVFLIDDLDRCSPEGALALVEGLRLLLLAVTNTGCRFVTALDRTILGAGLTTKFKGFDKFDANRYLEKIFPITFKIPTPDGRDIGKLLGIYLSRAAGGTVDKNHRDALSAALADPLFANPRLMKRCINRFHLLTLLEEDGEVENFDAGDDRAMAKWIAATERWPELRHLITTRDIVYWRQIQDAQLRGAELPDCEAASILDQEGLALWCRRELASIDQSVPIFKSCERRLSKWGL